MTPREGKLLVSALAAAVGLLVFAFAFLQVEGPDGVVLQVMGLLISSMGLLGALGCDQ